MKKMQSEHPEIRFLNSYGKKTTVDGYTYPSKNEADVWSKLRELGGEPAHEDVLAPISTPFGRTRPDTMLGVSVLGIPAGVPIEIKDKDGSWMWSNRQVWAVENGETFLVCAEDVFMWAADLSGANLTDVDLPARTKANKSSLP